MTNPEKIIEIIIFPEENTFPNGEIHLTEKLLKMGGEIWKFNKNDLDPFPSSVHGHNHETKEVIDGLTGKIYKNRQEVRKLKKNQFYRLQKELKKAGFLEF